MATPKGHLLDSFSQGPAALIYQGPFAPLWLRTRVGLTSILFQVTCLKPDQFASTTPALSLMD